MDSCLYFGEKSAFRQKRYDTSGYQCDFRSELTVVCESLTARKYVYENLQILTSSIRRPAQPLICHQRSTAQGTGLQRVPSTGWYQCGGFLSVSAKLNAMEDAWDELVRRMSVRHRTPKTSRNCPQLYWRGGRKSSTTSFNAYANQRPQVFVPTDVLTEAMHTTDRSRFGICAFNWL